MRWGPRGYHQAEFLHFKHELSCCKFCIGWRVSEQNVLETVGDQWKVLLTTDRPQENYPTDWSCPLSFTRWREGRRQGGGTGKNQWNEWQLIPSMCTHLNSTYPIDASHWSCSCMYVSQSKYSLTKSVTKPVNVGPWYEGLRAWGSHVWTTFPIWRNYCDLRWFLHLFWRNGNDHDYIPLPDWPIFLLTYVFYRDASSTYPYSKMDYS